MKLSTLAAGVLLAGASSFAIAASANAAPFVEKSAYVTPAAASAPVDFEVFLPLRNTAALNDLAAKQQDKTSASYHKWLTPAQFKARFGPSADSVARTAAALKAQGFTVTAEHSRSLQVSGTAAAVGKTFGVSLSHVQPRTGAARMVANAPLVMPAALQAEGAKIVSFAGRPPHITFHQNLGAVTPENRYGAVGPYWFDDMKQAYNYPSYQSTTPTGATLDGTGVNVAILMENDARDADVTAFFEHEKWTKETGKPDPTFHHVLINGGAPFDINASFEASLDVQQVLGGAPGANVSLVDIPDLSDENIIAGYLYIVESNAYDLVNSSFGGCELLYLPAYNGGTDYSGILKTYDELFLQGATQGITFMASSGDEGGKLCPDTSYFSGDPNARPKFVAGVSFPADSPQVVAVGGGNLVTTTPASSATGSAALSSAYVSENGNGDPEIAHDPYGLGLKVLGGYWGAGGGVSSVFAKPFYQYAVNTGSDTYRTLPDIGMQVGGCPGGISRTPCGPDRSAAVVADGVGVGGGYYGVIGTSVSSPEFVGATALYEQVNGRQGNLNFFIYSMGKAQTTGTATALFHRPNMGFDGLYTAQQPSQSYNYIWGNGTPVVRNLFGFSADAGAGNPQTVHNP